MSEEILTSESDSATETDNQSGSDVEGDKSVQMSGDGSKITSFFGFKMDYAPTSANVRDRKLRPSNYDKQTKVVKNPPSGKKRCKSKTYCDHAKVKELIDYFSKPHKVNVKDKVTKKVKVLQCTPEPFANSAGMLFCTCCRETLSIHKSTVQRHCGAEQHLLAKEAKKGSTEKQQKIITSIESFKEKHSVSGLTNLSEREKLFRYDVVFDFMRSGDPLESIDQHRALLEKWAMKLTESTHLTQFIPIIELDELERMLTELGNNLVFCIFDGVCFVLLYRWVEKWEIFQSVVRVNMLKKV